MLRRTFLSLAGLLPLARCVPEPDVPPYTSGHAFVGDVGSTFRFQFVKLDGTELDCAGAEVSLDCSKPTREPRVIGSVAPLGGPICEATWGYGDLDAAGPWEATPQARRADGSIVIGRPIHLIVGDRIADAIVPAQMLGGTCEGYWEAGVGMTLDGDDVTTWDDLSGNGRHLTGIIKPELVEDGDGYPAVRFTGTEYLQRTGITGIAAGSPYTLLVVGRITSFATLRFAFDMSFMAGTNRGVSLFYNPNTNAPIAASAITFRTGNAGAGASDVGFATTDAVGKHAWLGIHETTQRSVSQDGVGKDYLLSAQIVPAPDRFRVGLSWSDIFPWIGDINVLALWSSVPATPDHVTLSRYSTRKHGIVMP